MHNKAKTQRSGPRILISQLNPIGDAILTLPVVCALRREFPDAYIGWVVEKLAAPMVCGHHAIDAVVQLPPKWYRSAAEIRSTKAKLSRHQFGIAIDCQGDTKSALAGRISGAKQRIGYAGKYSSPIGRLMNNVRVEPAFRHLTDRSLELLTPLGIHSPDIQWDLPIPKTAALWASRWRRSMKHPRLAVLNPGGTWKSKLWEVDRFASTAKYLRDRYQYKSVVVWGSHTEKEMAMRIVAHSDNASKLAPDTDLHHLAALIGTANLFISGDSGPLHMAVAVGTPTIGLYGATRPGDSGPYGHIALQKAYERGSHHHRRSADNSAMRAIGVEHVCQAIDEIEAQVAMGQQVA